MSAGQNHTSIGAHNRAVVLDIVRRNGPVTRTDLRDRTGLTAQTVSNIAARLVADGLVREDGRALTLDPDGRFGIGIHLDPAQVTVVLVDLAGGLVEERSLGAADTDDPTSTIDAMADAVDDLLTRTDRSRTRADRTRARTRTDRTRARTAGIGVAVPGPIHPGGSTLGRPAQLTAWAGIPIAAELTARTALPVLVEKDVVASALAEWWTASSTDDLVSVYLGHGVGAGIVTGGEVVRGSTGNAGEFGGMPVHAHGGWTELWEACQPLQQVRRAITAGLLDPTDDESPAAVRLAFERLCAMPAARPLLTEAGTALGSALAHVVELLDLPRVVIGGSAALAGGPTLLDALGARLVERLPTGTAPTVAFTTLGEDVVARGAACAVLSGEPASSASVPRAVRMVRTGGPARPRDIAHPW
ncbi:ROK family transcriptional regulator [Curtobacterium sp. ZW137]|uniref:ROK family transcriptional regulator n=1 Tax=Curtobacterium sp. ZW137 TaxID=2485104 RepID=UPI000F4CFFE6|nr:ROK family transcriptional regulator [Curtobacterium sp. ZW137]ROP65894.1 putative NBD/HSP70 family sugar kinase [Curtobacterium sp. ZW137]